MWIKTEKDSLINLDHVRTITARDTYLLVEYGGDGKKEIVRTYGDIDGASKALGDLAELIVEAHSIPFADNSVVFEV